MKLESQAFDHGADVPRRHTCDGSDLSPPLSWTGAPEDTRSFALIVDDPDAPAGTWVHWVLYNLPGSTTRLPEAASGADTLPPPTLEGVNGWGRSDYGGPCPPSGTHRYFFRLYALNTELSLGPGATAAAVLAAAKAHVLDEAVLMGRYQRT
jgi:Raf kinase inhibitor-like YbhB/YbcL family protein